MLFKAILLSAGLVVASVCGASALSTASANPKVFVSPTLQTIACKGYNRTYRDFNHCIRVNPNPKDLPYCSRICSG
jgi:hypothetical protein